MRNAVVTATSHGCLTVWRNPLLPLRLIPLQYHKPVRWDSVKLQLCLFGILSMPNNGALEHAALVKMNSLLYQKQHSLLCMGRIISLMTQ